MSVAEELPRDKPEDTDQEVEVTFDAHESREIKERRPPLHVESRGSWDGCTRSSGSTLRT